MELYNIKYIKNSKEQIATCSEYSLRNIRKDIEDSGGRILSIEIRESLEVKKEDPVKKEKTKYYVSRYNYFYNKHEKKKITTEVFNNIKDKLRELRNETIDRKDFQEKFEDYLKLNKL